MSNQMWPLAKIGDVCKIVGGGTPAKNNPTFYNGTIPWATVRDMSKDIIDSTEHKITEEAVIESSTNVIPTNSVVIATRVGLGKVCLIKQATAINQDLRAIIPIDSSNLDYNFLFWWMKSIAHLIKNEGRGATVLGVTLPFIKGLVMPVPPLDEQKRIVKILDQAFEAIAVAKANTEKNLTNAREIFDNHRDAVFASRAKEWGESKLGVLCDVRDGTHDSPKYVAAGIPFVTQKNIRENGLSFKNVKFISEEDHETFYKRSCVAYGDILISMIGANRGMACIVDDDRIFSIKNVGLVRINEDVTRQFLLHFLKSTQAAKYVSSRSRGGAQEFIGLRELRAFPVPTPPLKVQHSIATSFEAFSETTRRLEEVYKTKLAALEDLKQSLLHAAFSGELTAREIIAV